MALREVLAAFAIQIEGVERLERTDRAANRLIRTLGRVAIAATAVGYGLERLVSSTVGAATQIALTADELGVTTDELQKYQFAADATGVKTKDVALAMRYLERSAGNAALGVVGSQKAMAKIGIQATDAHGKVRPLWDLLGDLADRMKANPDKGVAMAMMVLGRGGAALVPILKQGRAGLDALKAGLAATGGGLHKNVIENLQKAQVSLVTMKWSFLTMRGAIVEALLPALTWLGEKTAAAGRWFEWMREHTYYFTTALIALGTGAGLFALTRIYGVVQALGEAWEITFGEAVLEILPIILALGVLYLAFDDIYTFVNGGDSLIGRFLDGTYGPGAGKRFLTETKQLIADLQAAMQPVAEVAKQAGAALLNAFTQGLPVIIRGIAQTILVVTAELDTLIVGLVQIGHVARSLFRTVKGDFSGADQDMDDAKADGQEWVKRLTDYSKAFQTLGGTRAPQGGPGDATVQAPAGWIKGTGLNLPPPPNPGPTQVTLTQHFANDPGKPGAVKEATKDGLMAAMRKAAGYDDDDAYGAVVR